MNWAEARDRTLGRWLELRDSIGEADELELLIQINAICELCEMATRDAAGHPGRCAYCLASRQFGGCRGVNAEMSFRVVEKDWAGLTDLVEEFISNLRQLEIQEGEEGLGRYAGVS